MVVPWLPNSPDMNLLGFWLCSYVEVDVALLKPASAGALKDLVKGFASAIPMIEGSCIGVSRALSV